MSTNRKRHVAAALCALSLSGMAGIAEAAPVSAWDISTVAAFRNSSWSFGDVFTVGSSNITVTGLGALDTGLNGFISTGGILVGLFRESDGALLASGTVLSSDGLVGNYRFADIADIQLSANTQYRVVAVNNADTYNITTGTPNVVDSRITWNRYGYCQTTSLTRCDAFMGTERTWFANFQLDNGGKVPEPQSLLLVGLAAIALAATTRRRKQT